MGWRIVIFELDSDLVVSLITHGCGKNHHCRTIISSIMSMLKLNWNVKVIHCHRKANKVTDWLANNAISSENEEVDMKIYKNLLGYCNLEFI